VNAAGQPDSTLLALLAGAPNLRSLTVSADFSMEGFLHCRLLRQLMILSLNGMPLPVTDMQLDAVLQGGFPEGPVVGL